MPTMTSSAPPAAHGFDPATARVLIDIGAINVRPEQPYIFT